MGPNYIGYFVYSSLDKSPLTSSPTIFVQIASDVTVVRWDTSPLGQKSAHL